MKTIKKSPAGLSILLLMICAVAQATHAQTKGDIFGYYFIQNPPKAFADISEIHLAGEYGAKQIPVEHGLIRLKGKNSTDFEIVSVEIKGKNITFVASNIGAEGADQKTQGVEIAYKFVGTFLSFPNNTEQNGAVLQGTLTKLKGKKTIATAKVKFRYEKGD